MTTFDTPQPIHTAIDLAVGDVQINAGDRTTTHVQVSPTDPASAGDIKAAAQTHIEYHDGLLVVRLTVSSWRSKSGSVHVTVDLPAGSQLEATTAAGSLRSHGRLSEAKVRTSYGDIHLGEVAGDVEATTESGHIRIGVSAGIAARLHANTQFGTVRDLLGVPPAGTAIEVRATTSHGDITVHPAQKPEHIT